MEIQVCKYFLQSGSQEVNIFQRTLMVPKNIFPKTKF